MSLRLGRQVGALALVLLVACGGRTGAPASPPATSAATTGLRLGEWPWDECAANTVTDAADCTGAHHEPFSALDGSCTALPGLTGRVRGPWDDQVTGSVWIRLTSGGWVWAPVTNMELGGSLPECAEQQTTAVVDSSNPSPSGSTTTAPAATSAPSTSVLAGRDRPSEFGYDGPPVPLGAISTVPTSFVMGAYTVSVSNVRASKLGADVRIGLTVTWSSSELRRFPAVTTWCVFPSTLAGGTVADQATEEIISGAGNRSTPGTPVSVTFQLSYPASDLPLDDCKPVVTLDYENPRQPLSFPGVTVPGQSDAYVVLPLDIVALIASAR